MRYIAALLCLFLAGCQNSSADGDLTRYANLGDGNTARLDMPEGPLQRVAVWFHGQNGDENTRMNEDWLNTLRDHGWAVAAAEFHGSSWGNPESVTDTESLTAWIREQTGMAPSLWIAGSMGAAVSLNALINTDPDPACWYGAMPVVDLATVSNVPAADEQIAEAWNGNPQNPDLSLLPNIRYRVLGSPDDDWVPANLNGEALVNALRERGRDATYRAVSGEHGDASHFDARDLQAFADTC